MEIRKATTSDLEQIMIIYEGARAFMAEHGNPTQWGTTEPPRFKIEQDIADGTCYVCVERKQETEGIEIDLDKKEKKAELDQIEAVFYYRIGDDPTYKRIYEGKWLNDHMYGVVHRIASAGHVKGAGTFCLRWAYEKCGNLRIDTHKNNIVMQKLLKKLGFVCCGVIRIEDGTERLAYQKE